MSELNSMKPRVIKALRKLDALAVENPVNPGTPDVNYIEGWIELKWLRRWPVRADTIVKIEHYTNQQKIFAVRRRRKGGQCWLLLEVREQWLLFDGAVAAMRINRTTAEELFEYAHRVWPEGLKDEELLECISQTQKPYSFSGADLT